MIKIENTEVCGWKAAIRGMRNAMNSWNKSDTDFSYGAVTRHIRVGDQTIECPIIGPNDLDLMTRLAKGGSTHAKYRRMIVVYVDITAPLYWWKEFDTYKVGTVTNSCSTMHKIHAKEFTLEDFSHEHLFHDEEMQTSTDFLAFVIDALNFARADYLKTKDKCHWWQMIQLLPSSYNQKRTIMLNYEVLTAILRDRENHKLDEWHTFCDWIRDLPYAENIII